MGSSSDSQDGDGNSREDPGFAETVAVDENSAGSGDDLTETEPVSKQATPGNKLGKGEKLGRYEIIDLLGRGGMGIVYKAYDPDLDRKIALKVLRPGRGEGSTGSAGGTRLMREAQAMAKLSHPNVIPVYDVGTVDDQVFIAMELVDGPTLGQWLKAKKNKRGWREILEVFESAGKGLAAAHEAGLAHRDFKPDNVLIGADGRVRVCDFGLARAPDPDALADDDEETLTKSARHLESSLTQTGSVVGTPAYMAPEQHLGRPADERSDQFSFSVALYEALYGQRPFAGDTIKDLARNVVAGNAIETPKETDVPVKIGNALSRGLKAAPELRYRSLDELLRAIAIKTRQRSPKLLIAAAAVAVLATGGLGAYWYSQRPAPTKVRYYANFKLQHNTRHGVGEISRKIQQHRGVTWRVSTRSGRVIKTERINGAGVLTANDRGVATWTYRYDKGELREVSERTASGRLVITLLVSEDGKRVERRDRNGNPRPLPGSDASVVLRDLDVNGFISRERLANVYGAPRTDQRRAFGYDAVPNEAGQVTKWIALGSDGEPKPTRAGLARIERTYDPMGSLLTERYYGADGKPIFDSEGVTGIRRTYDKWGNSQELSSLGARGEPIVNKFGYAIRREKYDEQGNAVQQVFLDPAAKPVLTTLGYSRATGKYDERGNRIESAFFDTAGKPALDSSGAHIIRRTFDSSNRLIESRWLDVHSKQVVNVEGYARARSTYDERGNQTSTMYFDSKGKPTLTKEGFAGWHSTYDERNNVVKRSFLGADGQATLVKNGYAVWRASYDERGKRIEERYLDSDDKLVVTRSGYAMLRRTYDRHGNQTKISFFGADEKPVLNKNGVASERTTYDDRGNAVATHLTGVDGKPTLSKLGYANMTTAYDQRGNPVTRTYYDAADKRTLHRDGVARWTQEYDDRGNVVRRNYFDVQGRTTLHRAGIASWARRYDERGNAVEETYYGEGGKLTFHKNGYARMEIGYDARGQVIEQRFFDSKGRPTPGDKAAAAIKRTYDGRGNEVKIEAFGVDGAPAMTNDFYATLERIYDLRGNLIRVTHRGRDGAPVLNKNGWAIKTSSHDLRGNLVLEAYAGVDGNPTITKDQYSFARHRYDERNREVEVAYLDPAKKPTLDAAGIAMERTEYDGMSQPVRVSFFGTDGKPILDHEGVAGYTATYDARGNRTETAFLGIDGKPATHKRGLSILRVAYDAMGRSVSFSAFDREGKPTPNNHKVAVLKRRHDARGNPIEERNYGVDGKLTLSDEGYAVSKMTYDQRGNRTVAEFFGTDEKPILSKRKVAKIVRRFDARGNELELAAYDTKGKRTRISGQGPAGFRYVFQPPNRMVRFVGYDTKERPIQGTFFINRLLTWIYRGGQVFFFGPRGKQIPNVPPTLMRRAMAMMSSFQMEKLRTTKPDLFRGARGLLIVALAPKGEASRAGLAIGDIMLEYGGVKLQRPHDMRLGMDKMKTAKKAPIAVLRNGAVVTVEVTPGPLGLAVELQ